MLFLFQEREKGLGLKHMERTWGAKTSLKTGQKEETLDEEAISLAGNGKGRGELRKLLSHGFYFLGEIAMGQQGRM